MSGLRSGDSSARGQPVNVARQQDGPSSPIATANLGSMPSMDLSGDCTFALFEGIFTKDDSGETATVRILRDKLPPRSPGSSCLPGAYWTAAALNLNPVYSPASACPSGYTAACTSVATGADLPAAETVQPWPPLTSGEVAIGCCPSGFACAAMSSGYGCGSTFKNGETTVVAEYLEGKSLTSVEFDAKSQFTVIVSAIKVVYITKQQVSTPSSTPTSTTTPTPSSTSAPSKPATGLSAGQKAAIGICVPLFAVALLAALFFFCRRRRRLRQESAEEMEAGETMAERVLSPTEDANGKHELDGAQGGDSPAVGQEASSSPVPVEMPGSEVGIMAHHEIVELPGDEGSTSPSNTGRLSPIIRRKPVTVSPLSMEEESLGKPDKEAEGHSEP